MILVKAELAADVKRFISVFKYVMLYLLKFFYLFKWNESYKLSISVKNVLLQNWQTQLIFRIYLKKIN